MYILILHWLKLLRKIDIIHCSAQCIFFCGQQHLAFRGMVDLDIMVIRKFLSINEVIQLAKHNSIINAHLERPKLKKYHVHIITCTK